MSLKYYQRERDRWASLQAARIRLGEVEAAIGDLCRRSGIRAPELGFTSGNRCSSANRWRITINRDDARWLTIAHEVAHYLDLNRRVGRGLRRHGKVHARLVDRLCKRIILEGWPDGTLFWKEAHAENVRRGARAAKEASRDLTGEKIAARRKQLEGLEARYRQHAAAMKALQTRMAKVRRSLAMLGRYAASRKT